MGAGRRYLTPPGKPGRLFLRRPKLQASPDEFVGAGRRYLIPPRETWPSVSTSRRELLGPQIFYFSTIWNVIGSREGLGLVPFWAVSRGLECLFCSF